MITTFTKENLQALRLEIQASMDAIAAKHGITLIYGNTSFDPAGNYFSAPLKGSVLADGNGLILRV